MSGTGRQAAAPEFSTRPKLSDDIARYIRRRIFDGTYRAGSFIRLEQLATELGVSITPVREALFNLHADGLLTQQPRRGFAVRVLTARDIADVSSVQAFVGGELAARAALNITGEQIARLREIQSDLEDAYAKAEGERAVRLNHEFHRAVNVVADSATLTHVMAGVTRYAPESMFPAVEGWANQSIRHHRRIIAALASGDAERSRSTMADHLTVGVTALLRHLRALGVIDDAD